MSLEFDRLEQAIRRMRELQGALERQAYRDPLTDLANRALFMRRVHESLAPRAAAPAPSSSSTSTTSSASTTTPATPPATPC